jgi:exodeoxyribonuclease V alpha subunit
MTAEKLLELLDRWVENGWIRALDRAFAGFLNEQVPAMPEEVLLAAALVSHQLGRGHICLDLQAALNAPDATLSLPPEDARKEDVPLTPAVLFKSLSLDRLENMLADAGTVDTGEGRAPLVLENSRLYLRRYWRYTHQVVDAIRQRVTADRFDLPEDLCDRLGQLFEQLRSPAETDKTGVHWQSVAAAMAAGSRFCVISGGPGTGKTTTVVQLLGLLQGIALEQKRKLRIQLAAPTGKAAARLTESIGNAIEKLPGNVQHEIPSHVTTLHRLLGSRPDTRRFVYHQRHPLPVDLLVVDEASMIDLEMMAALLDALPEKARLILLGDKDQLASVEAGSVLGDLCRHADQPGYTEETMQYVKYHTGYDLQAYAGNGSRVDQHITVLRKSHRFGENSGIGALARAVNSGQPAAVAEVLKNGYQDISRLDINDPEDAAFAKLVLDGNPQAFPAQKQRSAVSPAGFRVYLQLIKNGSGRFASEENWIKAVLRAFNRFQLLAALRKGPWGVAGLNRKASEILYDAGLISAIQGWYTGRPVMITRNDYSLGLMNGDIGITLPAESPSENAGGCLREDGTLTRQARQQVVFPLPDGSLKHVRPSRLNDVQTVYAMTVHKSQGSEFEHTALVLPDRLNPVLTRELVYTGITRARHWLTLVSPRMDLAMQAVRRRTHRASGLGDLLHDI